MACCPTEERIKGAFSTAKTSKVGTGATAKKVSTTIYVFAEELEDDKIKIQAVNENHVPTGPTRTISRDDLLRDFFPDPEYYHKTMLPQMRELAKQIASGERHLKNGQPFTAELSFANALNLDEQNIRANFGIGLVYLRRGEKEKALEVLRRLVTLDAAFEKRHKHLFNEFGINLRRNGMYEQALDYYGRALDFAKDDEHLFFNIARTHIERRDLGRAREALEQALAINPGFAEARDYLAKLARGPAGLKLTPSS
ncbi:tetratricopeptide repeat protein [Desulfovibrio aminophilus]|uniref:tetratricopeptide repeat protein n=1 Tax=Desulfovibrio aminophilus TaxID=81425 RepID=UPI000411E46E|nr:tetratricopeptide repeat protein [Desulfovibrio aminophilus]